jgi:hypothetical protein
MVRLNWCIYLIDTLADAVMIGLVAALKHSAGSQQSPHCCNAGVDVAKICPECWRDLTRNVKGRPAPVVPKNSLVRVDAGKVPAHLRQLTGAEARIIAPYRYSRDMYLMKGSGPQDRPNDAIQRCWRGHVVSYPQSAGHHICAKFPANPEDIAASMDVMFLRAASKAEIPEMAARSPALKVNYAWLPAGRTANAITCAPTMTDNDVVSANPLPLGTLHHQVLLVMPLQVRGPVIAAWSHHLDAVWSTKPYADEVHFSEANLKVYQGCVGVPDVFLQASAAPQTQAEAAKLQSMLTGNRSGYASTRYGSVEDASAADGGVNAAATTQGSEDSNPSMEHETKAGGTGPAEHHTDTNRQDTHQHKGCQGRWGPTPTTETQTTTTASTPPTRGCSTTATSTGSPRTDNGSAISESYRGLVTC